MTGPQRGGSGKEGTKATQKFMETSKNRKYKISKKIKTSLHLTNMVITRLQNPQIKRNTTLSKEKYFFKGQKINNKIGTGNQRIEEKYL